MKLLSTTRHGIVEWRWKEEGDPSPQYKSLHHQWYVPKKSEFEIVTKLDRQTKQEVKDEIWEDMQLSIEYQKQIYKLHKQNKKEMR